MRRRPGSNDEQVLKLALEALVEKQSKRKACVPAKVKREVVKRDGEKCQWKLPDGGVCGATTRLEVDHVVPRGKGGPDTVDNRRILCRSHNLETAPRAYGDDEMDLFTRGGGRSGGSVAGEEVAGYGVAAYAVTHSRRTRSISSAESWPRSAMSLIRAVMSLSSPSPNLSPISRAR